MYIIITCQNIQDNETNIANADPLYGIYTPSTLRRGA